MPFALFLAMMLYQAAPAETPQAAQSAEAPAEASPAPNDIDAAGAASNLPKDDYGLVAWCHGALAGQLELEPTAHADMISIEGKAKVAARAQSDAQMEHDRREYLHEYERALAAAEKASPTAIHQYGVDSEVAGYKLWGATRQKQPIWRMLDWGMWDPNDAGCGDAAKRLYNRATLFGEALKGSADDTAPHTKPEGEAAAIAAADEHGLTPNAEKTAKSVPVETKAPAGASEPAPTAQGAESATPAVVPEAATDTTAPATVAAKAQPGASKSPAKKSGKTKTASKKVTPASVTEPAAAQPEQAAPVTDPSPTPSSPDPAPAATPSDTPLRGPQS